MDDTITITGNLAADPERRGSGSPIASFRVASKQRRFDRESGRWVETHTNWYSVSAFRDLAAHALQSLHKGDGVIVTGKLKIREYETTSGKGRSADIDAEAIGHDLRWGTTQLHKTGGQAEQAPTEAREWEVRTPGGAVVDDAPAGESVDAWNRPMTGPDPTRPEPPHTPERPVAPVAEPVLAGLSHTAFGSDEAPF